MFQRTGSENGQIISQHTSKQGPKDKPICRCEIKYVANNMLANAVWWWKMVHGRGISVIQCKPSPEDMLVRQSEIEHGEKNTSGLSKWSPEVYFRLSGETSNRFKVMSITKVKVKSKRRGFRRVSFSFTRVQKAVSGSIVFRALAKGFHSSCEDSSLTLSLKPWIHGDYSIELSVKPWKL